MSASATTTTISPGVLGSVKLPKVNAATPEEQTAKALAAKRPEPADRLLRQSLGHDDVAGIDKGREQHDERARVQASEVGAREQQHAAGDDSSADEHFALGGAAQQGQRWQTARFATVRLCKKPAVEAEVRLEPRHMQVSSVAIMAPMMAARTIRSRLMRKARLWKSSRQATKAMMQRSATILVAFMLSMPIFMRGYESPMRRERKMRARLLFAIHGTPFVTERFRKRILPPDVDVIKRMYLQYD